MARQFDVKNQNEQNQVQNNEPMTTKQMLMGIGSILIIILGIFYIIVKGKIADKEAAAELAHAEKERLEYEQEMADTEDSYDEFMNNSEGQNLADETENDSLNYAFDIRPDNKVLTIINGLSSSQKEILKTYEYLVSEGYDVPDIGCVLTDTFDYDSEGNTIDYHTQNKFYLDWYDEYMVDTSLDFGDNGVRTRIADISIVNSGWYYDLSEPTDDVLSRLFGWTSDESMFHLQSRLRDSGSLLYRTNKQLAYFDINDDDAHYYRNNSSSVEFRGYQDLFGKDSDSEMFKQLCGQVDVYNRARLNYFLALVGNIKTYIDLHANSDVDSSDEIFYPEDYIYESNGYMIPNRRDTWISLEEFDRRFPGYRLTH